MNKCITNYESDTTFYFNQSWRYVEPPVNLHQAKEIIYKTPKYVKKSREEVPWRWMAYEYLASDYFTITSDVWSFAVVVWEMFSFGKLPYGMQDYSEILVPVS